MCVCIYMKEGAHASVCVSPSLWVTELFSRGEGSNWPFQNSWPILYVRVILRHTGRVPVLTCDEAGALVYSANERGGGVGGPVALEGPEWCSV